jgi:lysophospholipase L1-like esterase
MMRPSAKSTRRGLVAVVLAALLASLAANFVLYRQTIETYTELQRVRLDPNYGKVFEPANAGLPSVPAGQKRLVLFGDSRISMWNPPLQVPGFQFVNRGVGGETTGEMLLRLDRDVIALKPDVVVIEMGINDLKTLGVFPGREGEIINSFQRNADLILERLRSRKIEVVLLTVFPPARVPIARRMLWSDATRAAVADFNRRALGLHLPGVLVIDCDPALADGARLRSEYMLDTLHLNPAGYAALNRVVEPVLAGLAHRRVTTEPTK